MTSAEEIARAAHTLRRPLPDPPLIAASTPPPLLSTEPDIRQALATWLDGVAAALTENDPEDLLGLGEVTAAHAVATAINRSTT